MDALGGLVNKSLVQVEDHKDNAEARYFFLETIRQYGLEKLKAAGKEKEVRGRHLTYFGRLVVELGPKLLDHNLIVTLKTIDRELGNLRSAIEYGLRLGAI